MAASWFDRSRIVAPEGWSRWLVPPAALAIHLSIGQAYAWSVFKRPLETALGLTGTQSALPFQLAIAMLGLSAAVGGTRVERFGPRWAMAVSAACWSCGFLVAAAGVALKTFPLVVVGYGLLGGLGLGIGYISPVSTLLKWFPDRPGLATGIAIMGFGGGALIASPWSAHMLDAFGRTTDGIARCFVTHAVVYACAMSLGVLLVRLPRSVGPVRGAAAPVSPVQVSAANAVRTPQFWFLWLVLCLNVTAGIGVLEKAAPMIVDFFAGTRAAVSAGTAAGFVALLSLANMLGRLAWSSASDVVGRKNVYRLYLGVGAIVYGLLAALGSTSRSLFVLCAVTLLSFYGGGFATIPAYLRDLFGTFQVGAIHGRLLTAWSVAGITGPLIVNRFADARRAAGAHGPALYRTSFEVMIVLLAVAFVANEATRPVDPRFHEPATSSARETAAPQPGEGAGAARELSRARRAVLVVGSWACVLAPFSYGVYELVRKTSQLFAGR